MLTPKQNEEGDTDCVYEPIRTFARDVIRTYQCHALYFLDHVQSFLQAEAREEIYIFLNEPLGCISKHVYRYFLVNLRRFDSTVININSVF